MLHILLDSSKPVEANYAPDSLNQARCNVKKKISTTPYNVCSVPRRVFSTMEDIMSTVGDMLSTVRAVQYRGGLP